MTKALNTTDKVDMLDVARIAQATDERPFLLPGSIKVVAPAKVNLYLEIGSKREDGYHEAISIMHTLLLHDTLRMRKSAEAAAEPGGLKLTIRAHEGLPALNVPFEKNIVTKAVLRLAKEAGFTNSDDPHAAKLPEDKALAVHIEKHIPAQGGLGGGSSDAAAALVGAAKLWGLDPADPHIEQVAATLGADVPFFLHGGCAYLTGIGDVLDHKLAPTNKPVVLIKPAGGVSTIEAYRAFDEAPVAISPEDQQAASQASNAKDVPLRNNLNRAAESLNAGIGDVLTWLKSEAVADNYRVEASMMSGSGAAVFSICRTLNDAAALVAAARAKGWWARSTSFGNLRAMVVPNK